MLKGLFMEARIYQPARSAMQSGKANTRLWVLEYAPEEAKKNDVLMGWTGSGDMRGQIRLKFETKVQAIDYADRNQIPYYVSQPKTRKYQKKSYADNFCFDKVT
jgi:hypothetical protein